MSDSQIPKDTPTDFEAQRKALEADIERLKQRREEMQELAGGKEIFDAIDSIAEDFQAFKDRLDGSGQWLEEEWGRLKKATSDLQKRVENALKSG